MCISYFTKKAKTYSRSPEINFYSIVDLLTDSQGLLMTKCSFLDCQKYLPYNIIYSPAIKSYIQIPNVCNTQMFGFGMEVYS